MNEAEARAIHDQILTNARRRTPRLVPGNAFQGTPHISQDADTWTFWYPRHDDPDSRDSVVVRTDGAGHITLGGIAKVFHIRRNVLGAPDSNERWMGSSPGGRYQLFERGIVIWPGEPDLAFVRQSGEPYRHGGRVVCIVAVVDIRGFTTWCTAHPGGAQAIVARLEEAFQAAFNGSGCHKLFVKGTGDGLMIVCPGTVAPSEDLSPREVSAFVEACVNILRGARPLPDDLQIGCGIDLGPLEQVFLFGQLDYLGDPVNRAAKLQAGERDTIALSRTVADQLAGDAELTARIEPISETISRLRVD